MDNGFVASFNNQKVLVIGSYTTKQKYNLFFCCFLADKSKELYTTSKCKSNDLE